MKSVRVLPAVVYDFLEFSALAFGGIGAGHYCDVLDGGRDGTIPWCGIGHGGSNAPLAVSRDPAWALYAAGIDEETNDIAVRAINKRRHKTDLNARVTFRAWCKELGVVSL